MTRNFALYFNARFNVVIEAEESTLVDLKCEGDVTIFLY